MIQGVTTRPRLDPDARGGLRLTLAAVGGLVLAVPFALLFLLVADRWGPLTRLDQRVAEALHGPALAHPSDVQVLQAISLVLSPSVFQIVGVVVAAVLILRRQPRLAAWLVVTVVGSGLLDTAVKDLVGRRRPVFAAPWPMPAARASRRGTPWGWSPGSVRCCWSGCPSSHRPCAARWSCWAQSSSCWSVFPGSGWACTS